MPTSSTVRRQHAHAELARPPARTRGRLNRGPGRVGRPAGSAPRPANASPTGTAPNAYRRVPASPTGRPSSSASRLRSSASADRRWPARRPRSPRWRWRLTPSDSGPESTSPAPIGAPAGTPARPTSPASRTTKAVRGTAPGSRIRRTVQCQADGRPERLDDRLRRAREDPRAPGRRVHPVRQQAGRRIGRGLHQVPPGLDGGQPVRTVRAGPLPRRGRPPPRPCRRASTDRDSPRGTRS